MESGSTTTAPIFEGSTLNTPWDILVSAVPECAGAPSNNTFDCLRSVGTDTIVNATNYVFNTYSLVPFTPAIDGRGGIIPDLPSRLYRKGKTPHIPFITGTNLDEGDYIFLLKSRCFSNMSKNGLLGKVLSQV